MNRHLAFFALVAVLASPAARGQVPGQPPVRPMVPPAASAQPAAHVAVIDVGYIFKNHSRFKGAMDKMKDEVLAAENGLKAERDRINGLMEQLKGFNVGTPEYRKLEGEVAKAQGDFNVNAQLQKKDFMDREAKVYLQVYSEIERAVITVPAQFSEIQRQMTVEADLFLCGVEQLLEHQRGDVGRSPTAITDFPLLLLVTHESLRVLHNAIRFHNGVAQRFGADHNLAIGVEEDD